MAKLNKKMPISLRVSKMLRETVVLDIGGKGLVDHLNEMGEWSEICYQHSLALQPLHYPRQFSRRSGGVRGCLVEAASDEVARLARHSLIIVLTQLIRTLLTLGFYLIPNILQAVS